MDKANVKTGAKSSNKAAAEAPRGAKLQPKSNTNKALGKGKGVLGGKKDRLSNDFST